MEVLIVADISKSNYLSAISVLQACAVISLSALTQRVPLVSMVTVQLMNELRFELRSCR